MGDGTFWTSDDCAVGHTEEANAGWTRSPISFPANPDPASDPVRYYIQTKNYDAANHWNYFAYWIRPQGTNSVCFTTADPVCPTIAAEDWIPVGARGAEDGEPMELYLAEIPRKHKGKTLNLVLWDVGEGMDNIQVLDPNGESLDFTWTSDDTLNPSHSGSHPSDNNPSCLGKPCLWLDPVNRNYNPKYPIGNGWNPHWQYNGRVVTLSVPLDDQVDYDSYSDNWFKLRFMPIPTEPATEWATFSVNVSGDPVRLTD